MDSSEVKDVSVVSPYWVIVRVGQRDLKVLGFSSATELLNSWEDACVSAGEYGRVVPDVAWSHEYRELEILADSEREEAEEVASLISSAQ